MRAAALAFVFIVLPGLGLAQMGNPGFMGPDTRFEVGGMPAPNQTNATDRLFAQLATEGGMAEIVLGKLATERAGSAAVGDFARRMMHDHSGANDKLAKVAEKSRIPLPGDLNAEHAAMRDRLMKLDGPAFDLAYIRGQVVDHQKTTQLLIWEINSGQDAELQQLAATTLPKILEHLRLARGIATDLSRDTVAKPAATPRNEQPN